MRGLAPALEAVAGWPVTRPLPLAPALEAVAGWPVTRPLPLGAPSRPGPPGTPRGGAAAELGAQQPSLGAAKRGVSPRVPSLGRLWLVGESHKYRDERARGRQEAGTFDRLAHEVSS